MGKSGNYHVSTSISIGQYRCDSKNRRRKSILEECRGDCSKAADMMGKVIASHYDNEIERKARIDKTYFNALCRVRNGNRR